MTRGPKASVLPTTPQYSARRHTRLYVLFFKQVCIHFEPVWIELPKNPLFTIANDCIQRIAYICYCLKKLIQVSKKVFNFAPRTMSKYKKFNLTHGRTSPVMNEGIAEILINTNACFLLTLATILDLLFG